MEHQSFFFPTLKMQGIPCSPLQIPKTAQKDAILRFQSGFRALSSVSGCSLGQWQAVEEFTKQTEEHRTESVQSFQKWSDDAQTTLKAEVALSFMVKIATKFESGVAHQKSSSQLANYRSVCTFFRSDSFVPAFANRLEHLPLNMETVIKIKRRLERDYAGKRIPTEAACRRLGGEDPILKLIKECVQAEKDRNARKQAESRRRRSGYQPNLDDDTGLDANLGKITSGGQRPEIVDAFMKEAAEGKVPPATCQMLNYLLYCMNTPQAVKEIKKSCKAAK